MWTVGEDAVCIVGRSATKVISEDLGSCGRGGSPQDLSCCRCCCRSATGCHVAVAVVVVVAGVVVAESARTWYGRLLTGVLAAVTERLRGRSAVKTSTVAGVEVGHKACVVVVAESVRT